MTDKFVVRRNHQFWNSTAGSWLAEQSATVYTSFRAAFDVTLVQRCGYVALAPEQTTARSFRDYASSLDFQPMDSLPWQPKYPESPVDEDNPVVSMPTGIVLRGIFEGKDSYTLIGNNTSGEFTRGCSCCSHEWKDSVDRYNGWSWAFPFTAPIRPPLAGRAVRTGSPDAPLR